MIPMTRRQPATAFCISLRISVACWTGVVKRLTRKRKASSSPRVSEPFTASSVPTTMTTAVVRPDTSWPVVKAMTARVWARTAERRCASTAVSIRSAVRSSTPYARMVAAPTTASEIAASMSPTRSRTAV